MPQYEFICPDCKTYIALTQGMSEDHETDCPKCGKHLDGDNGRLFTPAPDIWKCGGAYKTDYKFK